LIPKLGIAGAAAATAACFAVNALAMMALAQRRFGIPSQVAHGRFAN
jgi:hypothetical protein